MQIRSKVLLDTIIAITAVAALVFTSLSFIYNRSLAEVRPYVTMEIEVIDNGDNLLVQGFLINTSSVPAKNIHLKIKNIFGGQGNEDNFSYEKQPFILLPYTGSHENTFLTPISFRVRKNNIWFMDVQINYDGVTTEDHITRFYAEYNANEGRFFMADGEGEHVIK